MNRTTRDAGGSSWDWPNQQVVRGDQSGPGVGMEGVPTGPPDDPESTATVTQLQPDTVQAGGMVSVIVNGTGFQPEAAVEAEGVGPQPILEHISANQIQTNYQFPSTPGVYQVGVRNPGEELSNTLPFTVT